MSLDMSGRRQMFFVFLALFFAALLIYSPCLKGPFVWDDFSLIVDHAGFNKPFALFTQALYPASHVASFYYRPCQAFSYYLDYKVWGFNASGYHFTNILIHFFNAFLFYSLLSCRFKRNCFSGGNAGSNLIIPFLMSALFLVHPMALTSVAYISGRADLLVCFFVFAALLLFDCFVSSGKKIFFVFCLIVFSAALLSKESAVLAPFLIVGYFVLILRDIKFQKRNTLLAITAGCSVVILFYFFLRSGIDGVSNIFNIPAISMYSWLPALFEMVGGYVVLFFLPLEPHLGRALPLESSFLNPFVLVSFFLLSVLVFLFFRCFQKPFSCVSFGLAWFFVWIIPLSFFCIFFGRLGNFVIMPENHLYVAGAGLLFALSCLKMKKKLFYVVIGLYFFVFAFMTFREAGIWGDDVKLYKHLIEVNKDTPSIGLVYKNLGAVYKRRGGYDKAIENYQMALKIEEDAAVYHNLGNIYTEQDALEKARLHYLKALSLNPRHGISYVGLGLVLLRQGDVQKAKEMFSAGLKISPDDQRLKAVIQDLLS